jgi:hypothetical protein
MSEESTTPDLVELVIYWHRDLALADLRLAE